MVENVFMHTINPDVRFNQERCHVMQDFTAYQASFPISGHFNIESHLDDMLVFPNFCNLDDLDQNEGFLLSPFRVKAATDYYPHF